jgi:hypothetical protein
MRRFYGETLPAGPVDSYKPDMIKYLTIEQVGHPCRSICASFAAVVQ